MMRCRYSIAAVCLSVVLILYIQATLLGMTHLNNEVLLNNQLHEIQMSQEVVYVRMNSSNPLSNGNLTLDDRREIFLNDYNSVVNSKYEAPSWQKELKDRIEVRLNKTNYYLTSLLMVRVYRDDLAQWTIKELKQWIHYMFLIGVEHIYVCDHWHKGDDNLADQLEKYIKLGLISYTRIDIKIAIDAQVLCYRRWVSREGNSSEWMVAVDMDEYPFHFRDKQENFLQRYLREQLHDHPLVAEILMPNYLMLGQGDRTRNLTVDRIRRCTPKPANNLVKPLFQPRHVTPRVHGGIIHHGRQRGASSKTELRMLHYWGARLQNWGPDGDYTYNITEPFSKMALVWAERIRNSLLTFGENDAFSTSTGP